MSVLLHLSLSTLHSLSNDSITFTFSGIPYYDVNHFICTISEVPTNYPCTSPIQFTNLTDGTYIFTVAAVDAVGNVDPTPALWKWTVDTTPPDTSIDSATDGDGIPVANVSTTSNDSITFTFSGIPNEDVNHFICTISGVPTNYPCTSPIQFTNLTDGTYIFTVAAVDAVGNVDPTPALWKWTVDTTPPDTSIDSATDGDGMPVANVRYYFK